MKGGSRNAGGMLISIGFVLRRLRVPRLEEAQHEGSLWLLPEGEWLPSRCSQQPGSRGNTQTLDPLDSAPTTCLELHK